MKNARYYYTTTGSENGLTQLTPDQYLRGFWIDKNGVIHSMKSLDGDTKSIQNLCTSLHGKRNYKSKNYKSQQNTKTPLSLHSGPYFPKGISHDK